MKLWLAVFIIVGTILSPLPLGAVDNSGRIYGRIITVDGDRFEGLIRWDRNEVCWVDILDGTKEISPDDFPDRKKHHRRKYSSRRSINFFGITIDHDDSFSTGFAAASGMRFGHIKIIKVVDDDRVRLTLKSGEEVEFSDGSTDIGTSMRELVIEDQREGEVEFAWDDIERIELMSASSDEPSALGERLYGTVITRRGMQFTGYISWDVDESLTHDILDGKEHRRKRKIRFDKIKAIERYSSRAATVFLTSGDEKVLRGTNDVNSSNQGILISDPDLGLVHVPWDEFERVDFVPAPPAPPYSAFDGGRPLSGTVVTEEGEKFTGRIRWDDDEEYTWELLNGNQRKLEFDIEFGLIKSIEKKSYRVSFVTLRDGRSFQLRGSNDVDEDNKGIFVTLPDGEEVSLDWDEFERVEFAY